jgi:hypothetical protein
MTLVLGIEIVRVTVLVSGLVIFFANATTLTLDASINSSAALSKAAILTSHLDISRLSVIAYLDCSK